MVQIGGILCGRSPVSHADGVDDAGETLENAPTRTTERLRAGVVCGHFRADTLRHRARTASPMWTKHLKMLRNRLWTGVVSGHFRADSARYGVGTVSPLLVDCLRVRATH